VALLGTSIFIYFLHFLQKRGRLNSMFDWIFAFIHLFIFLGALGYAFYYLFQGNSSKFIMVIGLTTAYYLLVLHKAVKKEIERKRKKKN
jgi:cell shape-determining protein MreD